MENQQAIGESIVVIDNWLDTMRCPGGYGGPVVHWWRDSLAYTGPGLDWRYEGIITGYLNLYRQTGQSAWLAKARRAGDDLMQGQLSSGTYRNSGFEINPQSGGTPHEAACDLALLRLSRVLRDEQEPAWQTYAVAAQRNLEDFVVGVLWNDATKRLRNTAYDDSFVPNKAATTAEALLAWAEMSGNGALHERYVRPILETIIGCQVQAPSSPLDGGICQSRDGPRRNERYFPFYIARCIPALVQGHGVFSETRFLEAAYAAGAFVLRHQLPDGSFPQVVYGDGRIARYPQWVAGTGDIFHALDLLDDGTSRGDREVSLEWLLGGVQRSGGVCAARGFASQVSQRQPPPLPDLRDLLPVCGWVDKAFRYLSSRVTEGWTAPNVEVGECELPCIFRSRVAVYHETAACIEVLRGRDVQYRWTKGASWAEVKNA